MDKSRVDFFIAANSDKFEASDLLTIRDTLDGMNDDNYAIVQAIEYRNPTVMFLIAFFLGWERFWLDDIGLGVVKVLTFYGLGLWWLIDLFTVMNRTKRFNFRKFSQTAALMR